MPNDSFTQHALELTPSFATRVRGQLLAEAFVVLAEVAPVQSTPPTTAELAALAVYNARRGYARRILDDAERETQRVCRIIVMRTNVFAFATSYDFVKGQVVTAAGDSDILSQIATDWNTYAGI